MSATANVQGEKCITPHADGVRNGTQKTFNINGREYDINYENDI